MFPRPGRPAILDKAFGGWKRPFNMGNASRMKGLVWYDCGTFTNTTVDLGMKEML